MERAKAIREGATTVDGVAAAGGRPPSGLRNIAPEVAEQRIRSLAAAQRGYPRRRREFSGKALDVSSEAGSEDDAAA